MINDAVPSTAIQKSHKKKSLREKLISETKKQYHSARVDTQIILLENEESLHHNNPQINSSYEKLLERWSSFHTIEQANHAFEKYEEILRSLLFYSQNIPVSSPTAASLKALLSDSNAKDILLTLSRIDRKKIYKRLDSLLFDKTPLLWSFQDTEVQKIILGENIKFQLANSPTLKTSNTFHRLEVELLKTIIDITNPSIKKSGSIVLKSEKSALLVTKLSHNKETYIIKRIYEKAPNILDLMREKTISLENGNFAIKFIKKYNSGLYIQGPVSSGKTKILIAIAASLSHGRNIAVSGNILEFRYCLKDILHIPNELQKQYNRTEIDTIAFEIAQSGSTIYIADDAHAHNAAIAWVLHIKYGIPSIICVSGTNAHNSLYDIIQQSMKILQYSPQDDFFYWNFASCFPICIDLQHSSQDEHAVLKNITIKNNMPYLEVSDIKKLMENA